MKFTVAVLANFSVVGFIGAPSISVAINVMPL
jgi:hypothetical protein